MIDWPNEAAESMSPRIQWVKRMARGSRNRECVCDAIIVYLAALDLHPRSVSAITIS